MQIVIGIDIGGTKCAVSFARYGKDQIEFLDKVKVKTKTDDFDGAMQEFITIIRHKLKEQPSWKLCSIGISCGGPLDAEKGLILAPPNLPQWDHVDVFTPLRQAFGVPVMIQNDADACALAEWLWGAGQGCDNMIFHTFGTGLGAGLILDGKLYSGTCDMAGEAGHIRLAEEGPEGYGKKGSFEGFCSGGGIARYAMQRVSQWMAEGKETAILQPGESLESITTARVGEAAASGDPLALEIWENTGKMLGKGLSVLIDLLNPQKIVIGSIFLRQEELLRRPMEEVIQKEALSYNAAVCQVVPAGLGESLGDYAALSVAGNLLRNRTNKTL